MVGMLRFATCSPFILPTFYPAATCVSKLILIVEDNVDNARIYETILRFRGYDALVTRDGQNAVHVLREQRPDLILLDLGLPGVLSGWDVASACQSDPATANIPIVVLTAHAFGPLRESPVAVASLLTKPLAPMELIEIVEKLIGPAEEAQSAT
jgi:CheY-like chemotaxis protein